MLSKNTNGLDVVIKFYVKTLNGLKNVRFVDVGLAKNEELIKGLSLIHI